MKTINVDFSQALGKIKPMNAVNNGPHGISERGTTNFPDYAALEIPYARNHDASFHSAYGGEHTVDVHRIFRNFDADENDPGSYIFEPTDMYTKNTFAAGTKVFYRLGASIEHGYKFGTYPPRNYAKWARICEHIVRHYTEGWADGHHYNIRYWEIWNEPEVQDKMMWCGSDEEYYNLYTVTAKPLKSCFPHLKFGGYASCGFYAVAPQMKVGPKTNLPGTIPPTDHENNLMHFFYGFFDYIKKHDAPIDFFSWRSYADVSRVAVMDEWLHRALERLGYGGLETHLNEWNPYAYEYGTAHHSAEVAAMMMALQHGHTDICCIYDMRTDTAPYCPLFDIKSHRPIHAYYSLVAFNELYKLGTQVETACDVDRLYVLAASDGKNHALMLANLSGSPQPLNIEGLDLKKAHIYELSQSGKLAWTPNADSIPNHTVMLIEV